MIGTHAAQPIGQKIPSRTNIGMVIGEPLDFSRYKGLHKDRYVLRAITDEIMYNLMLLSGQEYVDLYAADVKAQLAAEGAFEGSLQRSPRPRRTHGSRRARADRSRRRTVGGGEQGGFLQVIASRGTMLQHRSVGRASLAKRDTGRVE